jgi:Protein of unknown function (DUF2505)
MATQFSFDHVFHAPSIAAVFAAYFDPTQLQLQDRRLDIIEREVLEFVDDGATVRRTCKVVPRRQLPAIVRPFVQGPLHYVESVVWRRRDHEIDIAIWPSLLRRSSQGKPTITALYRLSQLPDGSIQRRYSGTVSVDLALLSSRIERGIVAEFERSMPLAAASTQAFLDGAGAYVSAHA